MYLVNNKKAMTLVELLIVLAIITIVAGMLIPSFYLVTRKTRRAICINNLRLLRDAGERYCMDEKISDQTNVCQDDLIGTDYFTETVMCPQANVEYSSFIIRDGPVCPNITTFPDHKLED